MINDIINDLNKLGNEQTKKIYINHGASEPLYGVKIGDLKKLKKKYLNKLSIDDVRKLIETRNYDVLYFLPMIYNGEELIDNDFNKLITYNSGYTLIEYAIADFLANTDCGLSLVDVWINSDNPSKVSCAINALSQIVTNNKSCGVDICKLLTRIRNNIHNEDNRVKYCMNSFIIVCATKEWEYKDEALTIAEFIGKVNVDHNGTSCKTPIAIDYINKITNRNKKK